jgi:hypothetical protein
MDSRLCERRNGKETIPDEVSFSFISQCYFNDPDYSLYYCRAFFRVTITTRAVTGNTKVAALGRSICFMTSIRAVDVFLIEDLSSQTMFMFSELLLLIFVVNLTFLLPNYHLKETNFDGSVIRRVGRNDPFTVFSTMVVSCYSRR